VNWGRADFRLVDGFGSCFALAEDLSVAYPQKRQAGEETGASSASVSLHVEEESQRARQE